MTRIILAAVAVALVGTTSADAAGRKSARPEALQSAAVAARAHGPTALRPSWAGPNDCYTDDGYGRFWPCSGGPCGR